MNAASTVSKVGKWMAFFGWSDEGRPGSHKIDVTCKVVAHHGDSTWIADVEDACARIERQAIRDELEERDRSGVRFNEPASRPQSDPEPLPTIEDVRGIIKGYDPW